MKQHVRIGILASLLMAPAALASANDDTNNLTDNPGLQTVETTSSVTSEIPVNVVASQSLIDEIRLKEMQNLGESTPVAKYSVYTELLEKHKNSMDPKEYEFLTAKIQYLTVFADLKQRAIALNEAIGLLKPSSSNTIKVVEDLSGKIQGLESDFKNARTTFDDIAKGFNDKDFLEASIVNMPSYKGEIASFLTLHLPKYTTFEKFKSDIVKPKELIEGTSFKNLLGLESIKSNDTYAEEVKTAYEVLVSDYTTKFTSNEKQIFESHQLDDGRTVLQVINATKADITAADKVTVSIETLTPNVLTSASTFLSKMKSIETAYEKLTERQKALVPKEANEKLINLKAAYEVSTAISLLKPNNTNEYRTSLINVDEKYKKLTDDLKEYVINYSNLETMLSDIEKAKSVETLIEALAVNPTAEKITQARNTYNALSATQKKLVNNYTKLQQWETTAKSSITLISQIEKIVIGNTKTFASAVQKAQQTLEKLTPEQQALVSNKSRLDYLIPYANVVADYQGLRLSNKAEYRDAIVNLLAGVGALSTDGVDKQVEIDQLTKLKNDLSSLIQGKQNEVSKAEDVEKLITEAQAATETEKLKKVQEARALYNELDSIPKKIVSNLLILTQLENAIKQPLTVANAINAVEPGSNTFASKAKSAVTLFDKLSTAQKNYLSNDIKNKVEDFKTFLAFQDQVKALNISSPAFQADLVKARKKYDELVKESAWESEPKEFIASLIEEVKTFGGKITSFEEAVKVGTELVAKIDALGGIIDGEQFFKAVEEIETAYAKLSANEKKQVTNYQYFQTLKKDGTAANKVIELIKNDIIYNEDVSNRNYEKLMANVIQSYDRLTSRQKSYVYNYNSRIKPQLNIYEIVVMINQLKPTANTYHEDVAAVRTAYDRLTETEKQKLEPIYYKISGAETGIATVYEVMDLIEAANPNSENYVEKLKEARAAYDRLARINSAYQKLVLNYKTLTDREKALKPVTTTIYQIEELQEMLSRPFNDAASFVKKYQAALKSYEKIDYESRALVSNRDVLLSTMYPVVSTMEAILKIKTNSKTFAEDVVKAREWYDSLSTKDKALITNYKDLVAFEQTVSGGSEVDVLIAAIPNTPATNYMQAIKDARAAYNALKPAEKMAVTLYKELQEYEKGVKNVLTAIDLIDNLQYATNLVSAYDKATKALDKLTAEERKMVPNMNKLNSVAPAIEVYKQIANLKPGQEGYTGSVQAVYAAYNRLSNTEKQYVTNFAQLQEAKNNIDNLAAVISKISSIKPGSRQYAQQVQEALALYNTLPAALKKMVTNYDVLQNTQKELTAAEKVRSMIAEIDLNSSNFVTKIFAARAAYDKLTTSEKRLVSNYFILQDYEEKLGNMF